MGISLDVAATLHSSRAIAREHEITTPTHTHNKEQKGKNKTHTTTTTHQKQNKQHTTKDSSQSNNNNNNNSNNNNNNKNNNNNNNNTNNKTRRRQQKNENFWAQKVERTARFKHEYDKDASWFTHKKHFLVCSWAGRPIFSRYGDESLLAGFMGGVCV